MSEYDVDEQAPATQETIRAHVKLADDIQKQVYALGMRRPPVLGADLSDLVFEHERYRELLDKFLETDPEDVERIGGILAAMRVWLDHMAWEARRSVRRIDRVTDYCYERAEQLQADPDGDGAKTPRQS